jgi:hypothetical protein
MSDSYSFVLEMRTILGGDERDISKGDISEGDLEGDIISGVCEVRM